jgi:tartrate dehydrogenase/decarboxylase/D-malate dehydrogenase
MAQHTIALIPGDGIGREVVPAAVAVLEAVGRKHGVGFTFREYDWSCERFAKTGAMMPEDGVEQVRSADAILLGAVGWPGVPDHVSLWGLLLPLRRGRQGPREPGGAAVLSEPRLRTRDLGGKASTREMTDALVQAVR